ncbi:MAG: hypothetical protein P8N76_12875 [Pirellulaceae bacterium]|nr:hypothetical protein [Pirellulaceae bacterium]
MACHFRLALILLMLMAAGATAQNARDTAVRQDKAKLTEHATWLYDDLDHAVEVAARMNRPLMIVFR